jgi:hypothetical protein
VVDTQPVNMVPGVRDDRMEVKVPEIVQSAKTGNRTSPGTKRNSDAETRSANQSTTESSTKPKTQSSQRSNQGGDKKNGKIQKESSMH